MCLWTRVPRQRRHRGAAPVQVPRGGLTSAKRHAEPETCQIAFREWRVRPYIPHILRGWSRGTAPSPINKRAAKHAALQGGHQYVRDFWNPHWVKKRLVLGPHWSTSIFSFRWKSSESHAQVGKAELQSSLHVTEQETSPEPETHPLCIRLGTVQQHIIKQQICTQRVPLRPCWFYMR